VYDERLVVANAERLFVLDRSWRLVVELSDRLMSDVHDVIAEERGVWVAATGCDLLLFVRWDGRIEDGGSLRGNRGLLRGLGFDERTLPPIDPEIDWRDPRARGAGYERLHLNSLGRGENGLLVSLGRVAWRADPALLVRRLSSHAGAMWLHASLYSATVRATSWSTESTSVTPDVEWPALQMSRQRCGRFSRAPISMSLPMSMAPRDGKSSGSRPAATIDGVSMLVCRPVKAVVSKMSSALLATSMTLYLGSAMLSFVAMNFVPI
jgi:hypothetical protein